MHLEGIKVKNFMRIKEAELSFENKDVIGILGKGMDRPKKSNYIGKTTLLEAIRFAITGKSRASKNANLIHFGEKMLSVELTLSDDGETYHIKRKVDEKGKGLLEVGWGDKSREGQKLINDLLGIDEKDFDLTFYFQQSDINKFMSLGSAEKKKMVMKWQKNDHWAEREQNVLVDVKRIKSEIKEKDIVLRNLELNLGKEEELQEEYGKLSTKVKDYEKRISKLKKEQKTVKLDITQEDFKKAKFDVEKYKKSVESKERILKTAKQAEEEIKKIMSKMDKFNVKQISKTIEKFSDKADFARREGKALKDKISKLEKSGNGLCPIIDEECDRIKISKEGLDTMKSSLKKIMDDYDTFTDEVKIARKKQSTLDELQCDLNEKQDLIKEAFGLKDLILEHSELLARAEKIVSDFDRDALTKYQEFEHKIEEAADELDELKSGLSVIKHKIEEHGKKSEEIDNLKVEIVDMNEKLSDLQYVVFMFGKNGIVSLEIENSFEEIEDEINFVLEQLDPTLSVEFKPDKVLKTWEPLCLSCGYSYPKGAKKPTCPKCSTPRAKKRKDELQLMVVQNHQEMDFEMCSGGLKTLVSIAVRTALTMLLRRQNQTKLNVLFLDEIDSALDEENKDAVKNLVSKVLIKKLGFTQIFWISHDKTISNSVPHTILVKGYEKYSELEWV